MRKRIPYLVLFLSFVLGPCVAESSAQTATVDVLAADISATDRAEIVLRDGLRLELEHRWFDALSLYESALRNHPDSGAIQSRFGRMKILCEIQTRFMDPEYASFIEGLHTEQLRRGVAEMLLIQKQHFVYGISWQDMFFRGVCALDIALSDGTFRDHVVPEASDAAVAAFQQRLRRLAKKAEIPGAEALLDAMCGLGPLAEHELGGRGAYFVMEAVCGLVSSLDVYSTVLTHSQYRALMSNLNGEFVGIGVEIVDVHGKKVVARVMRQSPADTAGIRTGDELLAVNGETVSGLSLDGVFLRLRGEANSAVRLQLRSVSGQSREVTAVRTNVVSSSVDTAAMLDGTDGIAYVKISSFQRHTAAELHRTLLALQKAGMKSLILDLRGNPGGAMMSGIETADLFLHDGVIVTTRDSKTERTYHADERAYWDLPLALIINEKSASATEIFAGAILDSGRGAVIGSRSYGKGAIQSLFRTKNMPFTVKLTTAMFFSPSGRRYHCAGVTPSHLVHNAARELAHGEPECDPELAAIAESPIIFLDSPPPGGLQSAPIAPHVGDSLLARVNASDEALASAVHVFGQR